MKNRVVIGTRTSKLALHQTNKVKQELKKNFPNLNIEIKEVKTKGDILIDRPLDRNLDKGYFVKEIQDLLIQNKIDVAVHSLKDLPVENIDGLEISAILKRGNPKDVFLSKTRKKLSEFGKHQLIGTTSLRRKAQLLKLNSELQIKDVRGNVDTRIKKMIDGDCDGLVMAAAGIERLKLEKYITEYLDFKLFLSAPGQGAIAVETNAQNLEIKKIVSTINDTDSMICTTHERQFMKKMGGGCNYPIGAYSNIVDNKMFLQGIVLSLDGKKSIRYQVESINREENLALKLSEKFFDNDVSSLLNEIDNEIK